MSELDLIVVGGGHAGCEAAAAAARMGARVALVTFARAHIARLSCNPAIGGLAKGCLVRELDALGGWMAQVTDASTIQFRRLNTSKGLAVRSSRAQVDTHAYPREMQRRLATLPGLEIIEDECTGVLTQDGRVAGVGLRQGGTLTAPKVILTTGTFLAGALHAGEVQTPGGRIGEAGAWDLHHSLESLGLRLQRLKTGTPPRLRADTIAWDRLEQQVDHSGQLSYESVPNDLEPVRCWLAYTNPETHRIIADNLHRSAMFSGRITGTGPRYCPSVEDKIARFPDRERHLLFLELEGHETDRVYVNGLSTSLPESVQDAMVASVVGLESAQILQYGYAVEYAISDPRDLGPDLQHRAVPGLYLAGQINGTSGYEEAAVQGFVAGVAAARGEALILGRDQCYIGVLIDDLITRGIGGEPYRMFSSRAEHRLLLREDNADRRLCAIGQDLGLLHPERVRRHTDKLAQIEGATRALQTLKVSPSAVTTARLAAQGVGPPRRPMVAAELLRRPDVSYDQLQAALDLPQVSPLVAEQVETDIKYAGYIEREARRAARTERMGRLSLAQLDLDSVLGLSTEVRERLRATNPPTLASAARIPGVTPAAVTLLAIALGKRRDPDPR